MIKERSWDTDGGEPWIVVVAAGRQHDSPAGLARVVGSERFDPWSWVDEVGAIFERSAQEKLGIREASECLEKDISNRTLRLALLSRSWDNRSIMAWRLLVKASERALLNVGRSRGLDWWSLEGDDWGGLAVGQARDRAKWALGAWDDQLELGRLRQGRERASARSL